MSFARFLCIAFCAVAISMSLAPAADAAKEPAPEEGFVPLFNGKDLAGWVPVNVAPGNTFTVKDGEIHCTGVPTGVMRTDKQYENFIIEMDWMHVKPGGNSGLFIWGDALSSPGVPFARGIEVQILDGFETDWATSHGDVFSIHGATCIPDRPHPKGYMRCLPSEKRSNPAGQWNHYRVECNDGVIKLAVNGKVVSGVSKCQPRKGYICLESEGGVIRFKNIRIKELPSTTATPEQTALVDQGFKSLYTGVDLSGWTVDDAVKADWSNQDWKLNYDGKNAGKPIWTEKEFGDFEMIIDWRLAAEPPKKTKPAAGAKDQKEAAKEEKPIDYGESGILLRGSENARIKLTAADGGSGGIADVAPKTKADNAPGKWNRTIISVKGDKVTVTLNGKPVVENAAIAGLPAKGRIGLESRRAPVQFASIYVRELQP